MKPKNNLKSLDQIVEEYYGKRGTSRREKFEKGYEAFINTKTIEGKRSIRNIPKTKNGAI